MSEQAELGAHQRVQRPSTARGSVKLPLNDVLLAASRPEQARRRQRRAAARTRRRSSAWAPSPSRRASPRAVAAVPPHVAGELVRGAPEPPVLRNRGHESPVARDRSPKLAEHGLVRLDVLQNVEDPDRTESGGERRPRAHPFGRAGPPADAGVRPRGPPCRAPTPSARRAGKRLEPPRARIRSRSRPRGKTTARGSTCAAPRRSAGSARGTRSFAARAVGGARESSGR